MSAELNPTIRRSAYPAGLLMDACIEDECEAPAGLGTLVGNSAPMRSLFARIAPTAANVRLSKDSRLYLREHYWPGNVRELYNTVQRAFILADGELDLRGTASYGPNLYAGEQGLRWWHCRVASWLSSKHGRWGPARPLPSLLRRLPPNRPSASARPASTG